MIGLLQGKNGKVAKVNQDELKDEGFGRSGLEGSNDTYEISEQLSLNFVIGIDRIFIKREFRFTSGGEKISLLLEVEDFIFLASV